MKFEYTGEDGYKDLDLVYFKVVDPKDILIKGTVIEVPDDLKGLIRRMNVNGNYKPITSKNKKGKR